MVRHGVQQGPALSRAGWSRPYGVLVAALTLLMLSETVVQARHGAWAGDFWEHAAVVRELAGHLLHPRQPIVGVGTHHEFFTPYAVAVAVVTRVLGISARTTLAAAGLVNLALLVTAIPPFVRLFSRERLAPFFALLFALVCWGTHPLVYSGYLHLDVLGLDLPYPSIFATALALWGTVLWSRYLDAPSRQRLAALAVLTAVVVLTHPIGGAFLGILLAAVAVDRRAGLRGLVVLAAAVLVALAVWPYYPAFHLLAQGGVFDESNKPLYQRVLPQVLPALLGAVAVALRLRRNRRDALSLAIVALAVVYAVGWATSHWSYGRVLSVGVLLLQVALADRVAVAVGRDGAAVAVAAAVVLLAWWVMRLHDPVVRALPMSLVRAPAARPEPIGDLYGPLLRRVPTGSVVLAHADVAWPVPAFGDLIVDPLHPQAFVPDLAQRHRDVERYFASGTPRRIRTAILCRYHVRFVLERRPEGGYSLAPTHAACNA